MSSDVGKVNSAASSRINGVKLFKTPIPIMYPEATSPENNKVLLIAKIICGQCLPFEAVPGCFSKIVPLSVIMAKQWKGIKTTTRSFVLRAKYESASLARPTVRTVEVTSEAVVRAPIKYCGIFSGDNDTVNRVDPQIWGMLPKLATSVIKITFLSL